MELKFAVALACLVTAASAGLLPAAQFAYSTPLVRIGYAAPLAYASPVTEIASAAAVDKAAVEEFYANPQYSFSYDVRDNQTGDSKAQQETRNGDIVQGSYSVVDADGTKRTVNYTADPNNGFNAVIRKEPLAAEAVAPVIAKPSPVTYVTTPIVYSASFTYPAAPLFHSTPIIHSVPFRTLLPYTAINIK